MRHILAVVSIKDISVNSANLEQVYQYYCSRHLPALSTTLKVLRSKANETNISIPQ